MNLKYLTLGLTILSLTACEVKDTPKQYAGASQIREGNLHLLSIGISEYPNLDRQRQLKFAAKDADAIHNLMQTQGKNLYRGIKAQLLSDNSSIMPTRRNIEQALKQLSKAKANDTSIIFLSGHGINIDNNYYLIPRDAKDNGSKMDKNTLVSWKKIQNALVNGLGRKILLIDTCRAGSAFNPRLLKDSADQNITVVSATDADSVSLEMEGLGHGVFTYALLKGLKGEADMFHKHKKQITFKELDTYVSVFVAQLTNNRQQTLSQSGSYGFKDFIFTQLGSSKQTIAQAENFNSHKLPPKFQIISPLSDTHAKTGIVPVVLKIAENTQPIQKIMVSVNGREVTPHKIRKLHPVIKPHKRTIEVPLETGENRIVIRAKNSIDTTSAQINLQYDGVSQIIEGNLHLISIGISEYPNLDKKKQLKFAAKDANAIHKLMQTQYKKLYSGIKAKLLSDNSNIQPTRRNIEQALKQLSSAQKYDTSIIFLSGHGMNIGNDYYLIPRYAKGIGDKMDKNTIVSWKKIQNALTKGLGRKILLIDTCHAGNVFKPELLQDSANQDIIVLSATGASNVSLEMKKLGHGVFTYTLLKGLKGEADTYDKDKKQIMFNELNSYVSHHVSKLTKYRQRTISQAGSLGFKDFIFMQL